MFLLFFVFCLLAAAQPKSTAFTLPAQTTSSTGGGFTLNISTPPVSAAGTGFTLGGGAPTGFALPSVSASAIPQTSTPTLKLGGQTTVSTTSIQPITSSTVAVTPSLGATTV